METWRDIPGYEGRYEVSDEGRVKSLAREKSGRLVDECVLTPRERNRSGRLAVVLYGPKRCDRLISQLVLEAFVGPRPPGTVVCHGDGSTWNNRLGNLRYDTQAANMGDMVKHGRSACGERNAHAKLNEKLIRMVRSDDGPNKTLAAALQVCSSTISKIKKRERWRHV